MVDCVKDVFRVQLRNRREVGHFICQFQRICGGSRSRAYAHTGDWTRAQDLSVEAFRVSKDYMAPMLCSLWARIARETPPGAEQSAAAEAMRSRFACAQ